MYDELVEAMHWMNNYFQSWDGQCTKQYRTAKYDRMSGQVM